VIRGPAWWVQQWRGHSDLELASATAGYYSKARYGDLRDEDLLAMDALREEVSRRARAHLDGLAACPAPPPASCVGGAL
jgi:hypothetical protein